MTHDRRQVLLLARIMVTKHGRNAHAVAANRARLWIEADDPVTANLWREVTDAIVHRLAEPQRKPSLPEVLDGAVTRRTMGDDRVSPEDVEALMKDAQDKRQRDPKT